MKKILIGDDLAFQLTPLENMLRQIGYNDIDKAKNAAEVVKLHNAKKHDVVIIDIVGMESFYDELQVKINAFDAMKMIKKTNPRSKVIVITVTPEKRTIASAIQANSDEILIKGFDSNKLKETIDKVTRIN